MCHLCKQVDAVPVSFACRLSAAAGPNAAQDALVPQVGAWTACSSPQVFLTFTASFSYHI